MPQRDVDQPAAQATPRAFDPDGDAAERLDEALRDPLGVWRVLVYAIAFWAVVGVVMWVAPR